MGELAGILYLRIRFSEDMNIDDWKETRTLRNTLEYLLKITEYKEKEIVDEHKKSYITDAVENKWKRFVVDCMKQILFHYDEIVQENLVEVLSELFTHRHWGYGFFAAHEENKEYIDINEGLGSREAEKIFQDIYHSDEQYKCIYLSFANYCKNFFGIFSDNENSIRMICQYYPQKIEFTDDEVIEIASALYTHVSNAGEYGDLGYAYNGIGIIRQYIGKLPEKIILNLLQCYSFYYLIMDRVYRRQVYVIITNSCLEEEKKRQYKFFFMDSVAILKNMESLLFREVEHEKRKWTMVDWQSKSIGEEKITFFIDEEGKEYFLKSDLQNSSRKLLGEQKEIIFKICLTHQIEMVYRGKNFNVPFDNDDGVMNNLIQKSFVDKLELEFLSKGAVEKRKGISFSYVYLNHYRGLQNQRFSFDSRYHYDEKENRLFFHEQEKKSLVGLYGVNIHSIFCIVGMNGVGKTSFVDFLCESFLYMIGQIDSTEKKLEDIFKEAGIEAGTDVLVVFEYAGEAYMITNIREISHDKEIQEYIGKRGTLTHNRALSKIFYFSGKVDIDKVMEEKGNKQINEAAKYINYKKDYSEIADWSYKYQYQVTNMGSKVEYRKQINSVLCYQLFFLRAYSNEKLAKLLWKGIDKKTFRVNDLHYEEIFQKFISGEGMTEEEEEGLVQLIEDGKAKIQYFSSGQYAKFSFLSKLYWILQGYKEFEQVDRLQKEGNRFSYEDVVDMNDSGLIFIDEGEAYYHPEWQREYIDTLMELIKENASECKLQIVIATNSPFILSDIVNENITYIPKNGKEEKTFGQNIHTLLKQNFFMDYTIGEFARKKIVLLMKLMNQCDRSILSLKDALNEELEMQLREEEVQTFVQGIIDEIGEEVYKKKLQSLLDNICLKEEEKELKKLRQQRELLDARIKKLEKGIGQHDTNE